jgi:hypothetical protein
MKILFLCGSLEPGRDGVGDYVRRLSGELLKKGHHISAIALNDQHTCEAFFGTQMSEDENLKVLRLPSVWNTSQRFARAEQWVNEFNPDWVSLQFVPFAYHKKGLPFFLSKQIFGFGIGRRWHIMFHELWVGMNAESSQKIQLWGKCQKYLIKSLIYKLRPEVIHTQSSLYQAQLKRLAFHSQLLPLFANIPCKSELNKEFFEDKNNISSQRQNISLVVFGTIHPNAPIESLASDAALYAEKHLSIVTLIIIGRCGSEQNRWAQTWQAAGLPVNILGEQPPETISKTLQRASFGVATTPIAQIEKSGTVAAMLEHGLSVVCVASPWTPLGVTPPDMPPGVCAYTKGNFGTYLNDKPNNNTRNKLSNIARIFLDSLSGI